MSPLPIRRDGATVILTIWAAGGPVPIPLTPRQSLAIAAALVRVAEEIHRDPPPAAPARETLILKH